MGDDYNAYSVNYMQVSTNGTDFTTVGTYNLPNRGWESKEFALPASCEDQAKIWVRFMPDYASPLTGVESVNDGTAVAEIFVLADSNQADDHEAPLLVTSIPALNEEGVSATGSVILTFNEKVVLGEGKASLSTGIDEIAVQQRSDDKGWYNMMGMKVSATSKGVLIHQHKKVIVK